MAWRYRSVPGLSPDSLATLLAPADDIARYALIDVSRLSAEQIQQLDANRWGPATNLYADLAGTAIAAMGPRLLRIAAEDLSELVQLAFATRSVSFLSGQCDTPMVAEHLQSLREVELSTHTAVLFRYQDSHVTSALFPVLSATDTGLCLGPLDSWAALDVCNAVHAIEATGRKRITGRLRFDDQTVEILDDSLFVHTAKAQIDDVDTTLLASMNGCEAETLIRQRIALARKLGLNQHEDLALFCVLSLQFPEGFEKETPFADALRYRDKNKPSFGAALDDVPPEAWGHWDERLKDQE